MLSSTNSKISRVQPVFGYLQKNGGPAWPARLLDMAHGMAKLDNCGALTAMHLDPEKKVPATAKRLIWMLEHASSLTPLDGKKWLQLQKRVANRAKVRKAIEVLKSDTNPPRVPRDLILEGPSHADCLIECDHAYIWIEGKRYDWIAPSTTWDVSRDQLARNVEAVWSLADKANKEYRVVICHEFPLKHHETALLEGYRAGTWSAGWPHISANQRQEFGKRIGTLTWGEIAREWPDMPKLP